MMIYCIERPYVSSGLRKTYKKNLEVFSGELINCTGNTYKADLTTIHYWNKDKWYEKPNKKPRAVTTKLENIKDIPSLDSTNFSSLDAAKISKLLAIKNMEKAYIEELEALKALFERNVPDVSKPLEELRELYPEHFV